MTEADLPSSWHGLLESCLDRLNDRVLVFETNPEDPDRPTVLYVNAAYSRLVGCARADIVGRPLSILARPERDPDFAARLRRAIRAGKALRTELRWVDDGADPTWLDLDVVPLPRADDEAARWVVVARDITERKRMEASFLHAQRLESFGTLAGGIAHDLNNALAPILLSLEDLLDTEVDPERREDLAAVQQGAERATHMVRQLVSFARGGEGPRVSVPVEDLLADLRRVVSETFPKNIEVEVHAPPEVWPLYGNPLQIHQVLLNLCLNARDAMPRGGRLTVEADNLLRDATSPDRASEAASSGAREPFVRIRVGDVGVGVPEDVRPLVFEPFFTTKGPGKGTGLGLAAARSIVQGHGGTIQLRSGPDRGTSVEVLLPAQPGTDDLPVLPDPADDGASPAAGAGQLILLVDDEPAILGVVSRILLRAGYRVVTAEHGAAAVKVAAERGPHALGAVVTDMAMPVMDGEATIAALRALDPGLPILASSGHASIDDRATALAAGAARFLAKPFEAPKLLASLGAIVRPPPGQSNPG